MAALNLSFIDEIIRARKRLHGGTRGAPIKLSDGSREGEALNKACVIALSSALQTYVEDVFQDCSNQRFGGPMAGDRLKNYRNTWKMWGNPNPDNIVALFRRIGIDDVLSGLSWPNKANSTLRKNLNTINQLRNKIAHGQEIMVDGKPYSLQLNNITRWRDMSDQFGRRFANHAQGLLA